MLLRPRGYAGTGESGKSTIVKQMKILYGSGYSDDERRQLVQAVHTNLIYAMRNILEAMVVLNISLDDSRLQRDARKFLTSPGNLPNTVPFDVLRNLWRDAGVQECYRRRNEYQLSDSTE